MTRVIGMEFLRCASDLILRGNRWHGGAEKYRLFSQACKITPLHAHYHFSFAVLARLGLEYNMDNGFLFLNLGFFYSP